MKVFVVYADRGYDGYSIPLKAFPTKKMAEKFCLTYDNQDYNQYGCDWEELEIECNLCDDSEGTPVEPHIQVEYDEDFWGGDYDGVGDLIYVKMSEADRLGSVEAAFKALIGIDAVHMIHYSEDELFDIKGNHLDL